MKELDSWVTEYAGTVCSTPAYHIYKCIPDKMFDEHTIYLGAQLNVDESVYEVCGLDEASTEDELWHLVYVHLLPKNMEKQEFMELYATSDSTIC